MIGVLVESDYSFNQISPLLFTWLTTPCPFVGMIFLFEKRTVNVSEDSDNHLRENRPCWLNKINVFLCDVWAYHPIILEAVVSFLLSTTTLMNINHYNKQTTLQKCIQIKPITSHHPLTDWQTVNGFSSGWYIHRRVDWNTHSDRIRSTVSQ